MVLVRAVQAVAVINLMNKEIKMKTVNKIAISVAAVMSLGLAVAYAQPGSMGNMGNGMGPGMMRGHMMEQNANMKIMRELMTPSERLAMMDKMIDAKTAEERQAIMTATHTEMEKRAKEKGITLPAGHGPQMMSGRMCG